MSGRWLPLAPLGFLIGQATGLLAPQPPPPLLSLGVALMLFLLAMRRGTSRPGLRMAAVVTGFLLAGLGGLRIAPAAPVPGTLARLEGKVLTTDPVDRQIRLTLETAGGSRVTVQVPARYSDGSSFEVPLPGWRVALSGYWSRRPSRSGHHTLRVKSPVQITVLDRNGWEGPRRWRDRVRRMAREVLAPEGSGAPGDLLRAMTLGERGSLSDDVEREFRAAGLAHLLAVSGLHLGLASTALLGVLRLLGVGPGPAMALAAVSAVLLAALVGARPPVLRAAGMATVGVLGRLLGRSISGLQVLSWCGIGVSLALPEAVARPGFQLSFTACAALILGFRGHGSRCWRAARATLSAQVGTFPLVAFYFGQAAPYAIMANLLALPLAFAMVGGSLLSLALASLWTQGGMAVAWLARLAASILERLAGLTAALPGSGWILNSVDPGWALLATITILGALALRGWRSFSLWTLYVVLLVLFPLNPWPPDTPVGALELVVLDVGQGAAVLITGPEGGRILVDGGGSPGSTYPVGERRVIPVLRRLGVRHLDMVILTHPDADHGEGLAAVLDTFPVDRLILGGEDCDHPLARWLARRASRRGIPTEGWTAGRRVIWRGSRIEVLGPLPGGGCASNDRSVILRIRGPGGAILLPGDLEAPGEAALLASGGDLRARILLLPHHGSRGSSTPDFLDAVGADLVLVQSGRGNRFGHPHPEPLEAVRARGACVIRTDRVGTVRVRLLASGRIRVHPLEPLPNQRAGDGS